ncbi:MAG: hypothetical protein ACOCQE_02760 [Halanaerobium sp.]
MRKLRNNKLIIFLSVLVLFALVLGGCSEEPVEEDQIEEPVEQEEEAPPTEDGGDM